MQSIRQQKIVSLQPKTGMVKPIFRLRWAFHYTNGKIKRGQWNGAANKFDQTAAAINKTGLVAAVIEGEHFDGNSIHQLFACDGHDYVTAKWFSLVGSGVPVGKMWDKIDAIKLPADIIGLTFLTRKERVSVFVDGSMLRRKHRKDDNYENVREHKLT